MPRSLCGQTLRFAPENYAFGPFRHPVPRSRSIILSADGTALHVREYGDPAAEPIVLVHGWAAAIEFWNAQINELSGAYRVIAFDQRGHGRSEAGWRAYSADVLAEDLAAVLEATVDPALPATLVGHSMGGATILAWAQRFPELVGRYAVSALLANTATGLSEGRAGMSRRQDFGTRLLTSAAVAPLPAPPRFLTRSLYRRLALTSAASPELVEFGQRISNSCSPRVRSRWAKVLQSVELSAGVRALQVPTTVLYGLRDGLLPPSESMRTAELVRAEGQLERVVELPDSGHASNMQAIEEFNAEIIHLREMWSRPVGLTGW
ncbi:pimeloyl-ACP methyl ester carboxylesterase [Nocardia tenerifensis]|uniref:Pimeloyl-ACP methyl ester carboxylesterase n=1 Tax=Nocardia tenerifensis TaxID=228006 RepID=A0A318JTB2_9NOCA|nr:alpha/beta hydrolase [Nocardia tenerifensis]PXX58444.1 pimeloyl-ACP methyl ester carboxylesterase [Nocardia tenerifensis]